MCAWGWCVRWHPNINSEDRFQKLLIQAAVQEPIKVANLAVKALHDRLNEEGLEVVNNAGDGPWKLTGDEFLNNSVSLSIIQKAVQQSVDNINGPTILASNVNLEELFERVWKFVPRPTPASKVKLMNLVKEYTNPNSVVLSTAAAKIISDQVNSLIKELLKEKKLKPA